MATSNLRDPLSTNRVFVGGISWKADEQSLANFFSAYGIVIECKIIMDKVTGKSKGYGFVTFQDADSAANVKQSTNLYFLGKMMNVGDAVRKHDGVAFSEKQQQQATRQQYQMPYADTGYLSYYPSPPYYPQQGFYPNMNYYVPMPPGPSPPFMPMYSQQFSGEAYTSLYGQAAQDTGWPTNGFPPESVDKQQKEQGEGQGFPEVNSENQFVRGSQQHTTTTAYQQSMRPILASVQQPTK